MIVDMFQSECEYIKLIRQLLSELFEDDDVESLMQEFELGLAEHGCLQSLDWYKEYVIKINTCYDCQREKEMEEGK